MLSRGLAHGISSSFGTRLASLAEVPLFSLIYNVTEAGAFLITPCHVSADPKLINEQRQNSVQHNSNSMSRAEVYFT